MNEDIRPYDPTVDYTSEPAIKEITPDGSKHIPPWKPLNLTRRRFLQGVVCSGIAVSNTAILFSTSTRPARADARAVERLISLNINGRKRNVDVAPNETLAHC